MEGDEDEHGKTDVAVAGRLMAEMIDAERDVLKQMRSESDVPRGDAAGDRARARPRRVAACARGSGSDTMVACSPPSSSPVIRNASTPGCRCSSPPLRRGRRRAACVDVRRAERAAGPGTRAHARDARRTSSRPSASRSRARSSSCAPRRTSCRTAGSGPARRRCRPRAPTGDRVRAAGGRDLDAELPARGRERAAGGRVKRRAAASRVLVLAAAAAAPPATSSRSSAPAPTATPTSRWSSPTTATSPATGAEHELPPDLLLRARQLDPRHVRAGRAEPRILPPGPGSVLVLQGADGRRARSSSPTPRARCRPSFTELTVYTKDVAEHVCGITRRRILDMDLTAAITSDDLPGAAARAPRARGGDDEHGVPALLLALYHQRPRRATRCWRPARRSGRWRRRRSATSPSSKAPI